MNFNTYQEESWGTAVYPNKGSNFVYPILGLVGEAGEVAEKVKKIIRDDNGIVTPNKQAEIAKELGDVLWYIAAICSEFGITMGEVAIGNIEKLSSRKKRDLLHGEGDSR